MSSPVLAVFVLVAIAVVNAQLLVPQEAPQPFAFEYRNVGEDGGESSHQSQGDGTGRVTGSYTINDPDGRARQVDYVADELGFRATVTSNEPGVESSNPAGVQVTQVAGPAPVAAPVVVARAAPAPVVIASAAPAPVVIARPAAQPIYLRPAPQPVLIAPATGYRALAAPRYVYRR